MNIDSKKEVINAILNPVGAPRNFIISLTDFKYVFKQIINKRPNTQIDVILNGQWAVVQFSELCNHRIRIMPDNYFHPLKRLLCLHLYIEREDFEIVEPCATFYGQNSYITLPRFIKEEIIYDGFSGLSIFILSGLLLICITDLAQNTDSLKMTNDLLIGISSIFFSIFMLFTASQNLSVIADTALFKVGLTHRFIQIDKWVAWTAVFALGLSVTNRVLAENTSLLLYSFRLHVISFQVKHVLIFLTALSISMIFNSLLIVVKYYQKRTQNLLDYKLSKQVLNEVFEERNKPIKK